MLQGESQNTVTWDMIGNKLLHLDPCGKHDDRNSLQVVPGIKAGLAFVATIVRCKHLHKGIAKLSLIPLVQAQVASQQCSSSGKDSAWPAQEQSEPQIFEGQGSCCYTIHRTSHKGHQILVQSLPAGSSVVRRVQQLAHLHTTHMLLMLLILVLILL